MSGVEDKKCITFFQQKTKRCEKLTVGAKQSSEDSLISVEKEISLLEFEIQSEIDKPDVIKPEIDKPEVGEVAESFQVVADEIVLKQISSNETQKRKWRKGETKKCKIPKTKYIKKENVSPIKAIQVSKLGSENAESGTSAGGATSLTKYPVPVSKTEILFCKKCDRIFTTQFGLNQHKEAKVCSKSSKKLKTKISQVDDEASGQILSNEKVSEESSVQSQCSKRSASITAVDKDILSENQNLKRRKSPATEKEAAKVTNDQTVMIEPKLSSQKSEPLPQKLVTSSESSSQSTLSEEGTKDTEIAGKPNKSAKSFNCQTCLRGFTTKRAVIRHIEGLYCQRILQTTAEREKAKTQMENEKAEIEAEKQKTLNGRLDEIIEVTFTCRICDTSFATKASIYRHIINFHSETAAALSLVNAMPD